MHPRAYRSLPALITVLLTAALVITSTVSIAAAPKTAPVKYEGKYASRLGVGIGQLEFVDIAKSLRAWEIPFGGSPAVTDSKGWPIEDARTVFFDMRPPCEWLGEHEVDDPDRHHKDMGGTYKLSFLGKARLTISEDPRQLHKIKNQKYDPKKNITTADIVVNNVWPLLVVEFLFTNGGVKNVKLIRPGYESRRDQLFTDEFIALAKRFKTLRFMGATATNTLQGEFWNPDSVLCWRDRKLTTDATQEAWGKKNGSVAWEYAIALCNKTRSDMWINVPINATDEYVGELAKLIKKLLYPGLKVYLEYSNEVWNWGFNQSVWNQAAAEAEVARGKTVLNSGGSTDKFEWGRRRYIKRLHDIVKVFTETWGKNYAARCLRPVHAWQFGGGESGFTEQLEWAAKLWGPVKDWLHATSVAPYFNIEALRHPEDRLQTATVDVLIEVMRASSDRSREMRKAIGNVAQKFGIKYMTYEGGSDTSIQDGSDNTVGVAARIMSERDPRMEALIVRDVVDNWFSQGGDIFMFLELFGHYSRYGCWGLVEDTRVPNTPKMRAIQKIASMVP